MENVTKPWDYLIFADLPPETRELGALVVGDLDLDGQNELFLGGSDGLFWFNPRTYELGKIGPGHFHVGMAVETIDRRPTVVCGEAVSAPGEPEKWRLAWYRPDGSDLRAPWLKGWIGDFPEGGPHDILFADLDSDGARELVTIACFGQNPGVYAFKRGEDPAAIWEKFALNTEVFAEGLSIGDLDGDGKLEIVNGPDWYHMPDGGPFSGPWIRRTYAPAFREMCRTAIVHAAGRLPGIMIVESEYVDGSLSWFENRLREDPDQPWVEHRLEDGLVYAHSLDVKYGFSGSGMYSKDPEGDDLMVFVAEMEAGGWNAPYNLDARLMVFSYHLYGNSPWRREVIFQGEGTHQAVLANLDGGPYLSVAGKTWGPGSGGPKIQIWKPALKPAVDITFRHRFIDRDKPYPALEILRTDIDGDGQIDIVSGAWWYRSPDWKRYRIPGVFQAIAAYDLDGDGRREIIGIKRKAVSGETGTGSGGLTMRPVKAEDFYQGLSSDLWWYKPVDPCSGVWEEHAIGQGAGDWPHGAVVAPLLPGSAGGPARRPALVVCYHDGLEQHRPPELFEVPANPRSTPWPGRPLVDGVAYNEEITALDMDGDGRFDFIGGQWWFQNNGDGSFTAHCLAENELAARQAVADINGDGQLDLVLGQERIDFAGRSVPFTRLHWYERPADPRQPWLKHPIDSVRCAHSVGAADLDGDGRPEIIIGEHDPFWPYRKRCRLFVYKPADPNARAWYRCLIDGRFEHHDGAKIIRLANGHLGILSSGWSDSKYINLWEVE